MDHEKSSMEIFQEQQIRRANESFKENNSSTGVAISGFYTSSTGLGGGISAVSQHAATDSAGSSIQTNATESAALAAVFASDSFTSKSNSVFQSGSQMTNFGINHLSNEDRIHSPHSIDTIQNTMGAPHNLNLSTPASASLIPMNTISTINMNKSTANSSSSSNRKEMHRLVEKRRRDNINEGIQELSNLVPGQNKNKIVILKRVADYIKQQQVNENILKEQMLAQKNHYENQIEALHKRIRQLEGLE